MNIKRAKSEIKNTIESYLLKNEYGEYEIPVYAQRPVLLLGAPGIGKTQIMEQIARECKIALVSYTITHHTRQSAIGLPFISKREFEGKEYTITEYTMSEIVASIYEKIEETGIKEGILFIDEINCVSETLAPAMLQFLQCKTFGSHKIPEGWLIAAAGNPPEYNKSVREFDVVTMDRVKKIDVEPDYDIWKEYAYKAGVHSSIISYLNARPRNFYRMETTVDGRAFATPRGWEDLSRILTVYEKINKTVDKEVIFQYIQHSQIARDFANYYELYNKYGKDYQIDKVLEGTIDDLLIKKASHASFDEKLSVIGVLLSKLNVSFKAIISLEKELEMLYDILLEAKDALLGVYSTQPEIYLAESKNMFEADYLNRKKAHLLTREEEYRYKVVLDILNSYIMGIKEKNLVNGEEAFLFLKEAFTVKKNEYEEMFDRTGIKLENAFDFMESVFSDGQEMVVFITELNSGYYSVLYLQEYDCDRYQRYNEELLCQDKGKDIMRRIKELG